MKVTLVPWQIVAPGFAEILTPGVTEVVRVMVITLDVAVKGEAQPELEVMTQLTWSPFTSAALV